MMMVLLAILAVTVVMMRQPNGNAAMLTGLQKHLVMAVSNALLVRGRVMVAGSDMQHGFAVGIGHNMPAGRMVVMVLMLMMVDAGDRRLGLVVLVMRGSAKIDLHLTPKTGRAVKVYNRGP